MTKEDLFRAIQDAWDELKLLRREIRKNPNKYLLDEEVFLVDWLKWAETEYYKLSK